MSPLVDQYLLVNESKTYTLTLVPTFFDYYKLTCSLGTAANFISYSNGNF